MASFEIDVDAELKAFSFTQRAHRDVYPANDSRHSELSQAGKVIVTGASRGIGKQVSLTTYQDRVKYLSVWLTAS